MPPAEGGRAARAGPAQVEESRRQQPRPSQLIRAP
nr:MAG TPA: hypothetical protein [Caudoviricetes sp.]